MRRIIRPLLLAAAAAALAAGAGACGGGQKGTPGSIVDPPPPPKPGKPGEKREITADAKRDYERAAAFFKEQAEGGWNQQKCQAAAQRFLSVASDHPTLVEARYMAGFSFHQCQMFKAAASEYQAALQTNSAHAPSLSNAGEIYYHAGNVQRAKEYWESAVKADGFVVGARNNLAWLLIEQMRETRDRSAWTKLEEQARAHLSSVLAVDNENVKAYVLYGLLYMEGHERNRNRLDLAALLLDEAAKRNEQFAPLYNARGLLMLHRNNVGEALAHFERAIRLDPEFTEAHMNVGNITLGFRKYDRAHEAFTKVLEKAPDSCEAHIGMGVAQRGQGQLDAAEASYNRAAKQCPQMGAPIFNLAVLYKDFRANAAADVKVSKQHYETARKHFRDFLGKSDVTPAQKKEAQENIGDLDRIIRQLDELIRAMAQSSSAGGGAPAGSSP